VPAAARVAGALKIEKRGPNGFGESGGPVIGRCLRPGAG
jgi:hypothetical protein